MLRGSREYFSRSTRLSRPAPASGSVRRGRCKVAAAGRWVFSLHRSLPAPHRCSTANTLASASACVGRIVWSSSLVSNRPASASAFIAGHCRARIGCRDVDGRVRIVEGVWPLPAGRTCAIPFHAPRAGDHGFHVRADSAYCADGTERIGIDVRGRRRRRMRYGRYNHQGYFGESFVRVLASAAGLVAEPGHRVLADPGRNADH